MRHDDTSSAERFLARVRPLQRELEVYCRRLIWEPQEVPDAIQNTLLRAFAAFDRYREEASFSAWIFTILTREVFALNRKHARIAKFEYQVEPEELDETAGGLASEAVEGEDWMEEDLALGLRTLTDVERAVLLMRALNGFRYREIGEALEIPIGSVMGYLARARQKMQGALRRSRTKPELS
jgi:RNA polymerase sigma-70 factor (ECF subfamily)